MKVPSEGKKAVYQQAAEISLKPLSVVYYKIEEVETKPRKSVAKKAEPSKKATAKKAEPAKKAAAPAKKAPAKKAAPAKATAPKAVKLFVEYQGGQVSTQDIAAKAAEASGKKAIKELNVYYQPETNMVYYTADGTEGSFSL